MTRPLPGDLDDLSTDPFDVARAAAALLTDLTGIARHEIALVPGSGWGGAAARATSNGSVDRSSRSPGSCRAMVRGYLPAGGLRRLTARCRLRGAVRPQDHDERQVVGGERIAAHLGAQERHAAPEHPVDPVLRVVARAGQRRGIAGNVLRAQPPVVAGQQLDLG